MPIRRLVDGIGILGQLSQPDRALRPDRYGFAAKDWNTYFYDGGYEASINYNPTTSNCDPNAIACYAATALQGVDLYFGDSGPSGYRTQFVELDISVDNTYEILMKDGLVSYRITDMPIPAMPMP